MASVIDRLFNTSFGGIEKTLDLTWQRNQALSSNLANAETPQYRAVDMSFANELEKAFDTEQASLKTTDSKHLDIGEDTNSHLVPDFTGATKPDGNNVDIDLQMGKLAANSGEYMNAARLMRKQLAFVRNAIRSSER